MTFFMQNYTLLIYALLVSFTCYQGFLPASAASKAVTMASANQDKEPESTVSFSPETGEEDFTEPEDSEDFVADTAAGIDLKPSAPARSNTALDQEATEQAMVIGTFPEQALDEDQDGISDLDDNCPQTPKRMQTLTGIQPMKVDECGCPIDVCKLDQDHDGINDCQDKCIDTPADLEVDKAGCPKLVVQPQRFVLDVKFEFAKANIQGQFVDDLEALRALMVRYPKLTITLEGHTDNVGSDGYNQSLSQVRAQMCRRYLLSAGDIDPSRIQAVGFGESQPVASNRTEAGRAQNRRTLAVLNYLYAFNPLKKPSKPQ
jgi:outer membrane protein OmpA-like peptidoglycan-associated protein